MHFRFNLSLLTLLFTLLVWSCSNVSDETGYGPVVTNLKVFIPTTINSEEVLKIAEFEIDNETQTLMGVFTDDSTAIHEFLVVDKEDSDLKTVYWYNELQELGYLYNINKSNNQKEDYLVEFSQLNGESDQIVVVAYEADWASGSFDRIGSLLIDDGTTENIGRRENECAPCDSYGGCDPNGTNPYTWTDPEYYTLCIGQWLCEARLAACLYDVRDEIAEWLCNLPENANNPACQIEPPTDSDLPDGIDPDIFDGNVPDQPIADDLPQFDAYIKPGEGGSSVEERDNACPGDMLSDFWKVVNNENEQIAQPISGVQIIGTEDVSTNLTPSDVITVTPVTESDGRIRAFWTVGEYPDGAKRKLIGFKSTSHTTKPMYWSFLIEPPEEGCGGSTDSTGATGSFTDPRDGQTYNTIEIGTQTWMAENLNYNASNSLCYDDNPFNCNTYGRLYDWNIAINVCPIGWHLPSDLEWTQLADFLGGESIAGGKMKEAGTTHWQSPNEGATNSSGFTGLPGGGYITFDGIGTDYRYLGTSGFWWSATDYDAETAWYWGLSSGVISLGKGRPFKYTDLSVRCVKD